MKTESLIHKSIVNMFRVFDYFHTRLHFSSYFVIWLLHPLLLLFCFCGIASFSHSFLSCSTGCAFFIAVSLHEILL